MRFVIKQGKDGKYRAMLDNHDQQETLMIPCQSFDNPRDAAGYALLVIAACRQAEVFTADGNRWMF